MARDLTVLQILDGKKREFKSKSFVASDTKGSVPQVSNTDSHKRKRDTTNVNDEPALKRQKIDHVEREVSEDAAVLAPEQNSRKDKPSFQKRKDGQVPDERQNTNQKFQPRNDRAQDTNGQQSRNKNSKFSADRLVQRENHKQPKKGDSQQRNDKSQLPKQNKVGPKSGKPDRTAPQTEPTPNKKSKRDGLEQMTPVKEVSVKVTDDNALADDPQPDHVTRPSSGIVNITLAAQKKQFSVNDLLSNSEQQVAGW